MPRTVKSPNKEEALFQKEDIEASDAILETFQAQWPEAAIDEQAQ